MPDLAIFLIVFFASFTQGLAGFGLALVSMPLLTAQLLPLEVAAPLMALIGVTIRFLMLLRYRQSFAFAEIRYLVVGAVIGIPIGIFVIQRLVDRQLVTVVLGIVVILYALYNLFLRGQSILKIENNRWGIPTGFISGLLGGAYNIIAPPVVIYGDSRGWKPLSFKANLQGYTLLTTIMIVISHMFAGNVTDGVSRLYLWTIPVVLLGMIIGMSLDRVINPELFRKIVLVLLILTGMNLII